MIIFPDLPHMEVEGVEVAEEITLILRTTSPTASCPSCGTVSSRIQSRYTRTLRDLPSVGHPLRLIMHVRRFFCKKSTCAQKIFVERLPDLCRPHAQRTKRLQEALRHLGLSMGGQRGADVGSEHGINGSRDTILRLVHQSEPPAKSEPRVIGLDDWAWKRKRRYGTLICDLEQGLPIDLLPDRSVETVSAWLEKHPTIDTISRDGSSEYASAIKKGAPQAREVSDRWHLVKNLTGCVSVLIAESFAQLRRAESAAAAQEEQVEPLSQKQNGHPRTRAERHAQQARAAERQARYEQISDLQKQGMKSAEIAAVVGMAERTVRHWLSQRGIPYSGPRKPRSSPLDPYKTYLLERWHQGCRSGAQLERELRAKGYKGSQKAIYRCLASLELFLSSPSRRSGAQSRETTKSQHNPLLALSASQATWLFFRKEEDLKAEEQENLRLLRQASPDLETAYQLVQEFLSMVRELTGERLEEWLGKVEAEALQAFQPFVTGVQQDKDAVLAGLTLPWSNGPLEGNVNRLKLIKRSMYGQADLNLLKLRVLHHSPKNLERKNKKMQAQQKDPLEISRGRKKDTSFQHTTNEISKVA
jgi:transposase